MLSFFKKSVRTEADLSFIGADMHSHLLPGIDDGLRTLEESVSFIGELYNIGYRKLICTPHIISDIYPNSPETIMPKLKLVKDAIKKEGIDMVIEAAAEYMVDMDMEKHITENKPLLTFGKDLILIEMSFVAPSANIEQVIFQLRLKGIRPVLAHPERYAYYHNDFEKYTHYLDLGCLLQVNLLSLLGYYGKPTKVVAEKLVKHGMVDLLGTDVHHEKHLAALKELASKKEFYKQFEGVEIQNRKLLM
jgi:tyrosine-protein phosphatase YwqE